MGWEEIKLLLYLLLPLAGIAILIILMRLFFDFWLPSFFSKIKIKRKIKNNLSYLSGLDLLDQLKNLSSGEFEQYIAEIFSKLGYKTMVVGKSHDRGVDVVAEKDSIEHYIQCKRYQNTAVPVQAVRDFYGVLARSPIQR